MITNQIPDYGVSNLCNIISQYKKTSSCGHLDIEEVYKFEMKVFPNLKKLWYLLFNFEITWRQ